MKRGAIILILVLICSIVVSAQLTEEEDVSRRTRDAGETKKQIEGSINKNKQSTTPVDTSTTVTPNQPHIRSANLPSGSTVKTTKDSFSSTKASSFESDSFKGSNLNNLQSNKDGTFSASSAESLSFPPQDSTIQSTEVNNAQFSEKTLKVKSAQSFSLPIKNMYFDDIGESQFNFDANNQWK